MTLSSDHVGSVMNLMDLMQGVPEDSFEDMISNILKTVGKPFIMKLILHGLLSMNRNDAQSQLLAIIQCVSNVMESKSEVDEEAIEEESNAVMKINSKEIISLKDLPSDALCKVCTFLSFKQLMKLELCSRYLCMISRMSASVEVVTEDSNWFIKYWIFMDEELLNSAMLQNNNNNNINDLFDANDKKLQLKKEKKHLISISSERKLSYFHRFKSVSSLTLKVHSTSASPFNAEQYYSQYNSQDRTLATVKTCAQSFQRALELCNKHIFHRNIKHLYFAIDLEYFAIEQTHGFIPYFENLESIEFAPHVPFNHMLLFLSNHQKMCSHQQNNMSIISKIRSLKFCGLSFSHENKMENAALFMNNDSMWQQQPLADEKKDEVDDQKKSDKKINFDLLYMKIDFNQIWKWFEILANFNPQSLHFELNDNSNNIESNELVKSEFSSLDIPFSFAFSNLRYLYYSFGDGHGSNMQGWNEDTNEVDKLRIITPFIVQLIKHCSQNLIELRMENINMHEFWFKRSSEKKTRNKNSTNDIFNENISEAEKTMAFSKLKKLTIGRLGRRQLYDLLNTMADNSPKLQSLRILDTKQAKYRGSSTSSVFYLTKSNVRNETVIDSIRNFILLHFCNSDQLMNIEIICDLPLSQICLMFISVLKNKTLMKLKRHLLNITLNINAVDDEILFGFDVSAFQCGWHHSFVDFLNVLKNSVSETHLKLWIKLDNAYNEQNWIRFLFLMQFQQQVNHYRILSCSYTDNSGSWNDEKAITLEVVHGPFSIQNNEENKIDDENGEEIFLKKHMYDLGTKHVQNDVCKNLYSNSGNYYQHILLCNAFSSSRILFDRCTEELRYVDEFECVDYYVFADEKEDDMDVEVIECNARGMHVGLNDSNAMFDAFPEFEDGIFTQLEFDKYEKNNGENSGFPPNQCFGSKELIFRNTGNQHFVQNAMIIDSNKKNKHNYTFVHICLQQSPVLDTVSNEELRYLDENGRENIIQDMNANQFIDKHESKLECKLSANDLSSNVIFPPFDSPFSVMFDTPLPFMGETQVGFNFDFNVSDCESDVQSSSSASLIESECSEIDSDGDPFLRMIGRKKRNIGPSFFHFSESKKQDFCSLPSQLKVMMDGSIDEEDEETSNKLKVVLLMDMCGVSMNTAYNLLQKNQWNVKYASNECREK